MPSTDAGWLWPALAGPYVAAAALLVLAGVPKVRDPMPLVRALRSAGWPSGRGLVRLVAVVETAIGLLALAVPSRPTGLLLAMSYAVFTVFVVVALRRGGVLASCGCFGKADTPPGLPHAVLTGAAVLVGLGVAASPPADAWGDLTLTGGIGILLLAGTIAFLAWQVMAVLPSVTPAAVRSTGTRSSTER